MKTAGSTANYPAPAGLARQKVKKKNLKTGLLKTVEKKETECIVKKEKPIVH